MDNPQEATQTTAESEFLLIRDSQEAEAGKAR